MIADPGMVIIGAGECGGRAALALREHGYDGPIRLIGAERHLPYERPPLSKAMLAADGAGAAIAVRSEQLESARIVHRAGTVATAIDRQRKRVALSDGEALPYDRLLLATGARARKLTQGGVDVAGVRYLRTMEDCLALREKLVPGARLLVLGGGFLGLEIAATAAMRGARVTVVEAQDRVLMRGVPEPIARVVEDRHGRQGVEILCGAKIRSIETAEGWAAITLEDGTRLVGDMLVASVGAVPNSELAEAAGLAVANGIIVDGLLKTSDDDIFAAGDCCMFPLASQNGRMVRLESWRNAIDQSAVVAANMLGKSVPHIALPWFWSDQYELTLQVAGLVDAGLRMVRRDLGDSAFLLFHLDADGRLVAASGIGVGGAVARDIRLADMLIARRVHPDPALLAHPDARLKAMLG